MALDFEDIIFPLSLDFHDPDVTWWVAHTKPNQERKLSFELKQSSVSHFLPLVEKRLKTKKKKGELAIRPLFPGYLFLAGDREDRKKALETGRIANVISVLDQEQLANELEQVYLALQSGLTIDPCPTIQKGKIYKVVEGPGMGLEGKVVSVAKKRRIVIEIETIGQSLMIEVEADNLVLAEKNLSP